MTNTHIEHGTAKVTTRIPEGRKVEGLIYGAHVSQSSRGRSGYYVTTPLAARWGVAWESPEVEADDEDIVDDIAGELGEITDAMIRALRDEAATAGDMEMVGICDAALGTPSSIQMMTDAARAACAAAIRRAQG